MIFSWVRRGLRTGVLTTRYPAVQEHMPEGFRGKPVLDANRCLAGQGCDACVQVCLPAALSLTEAVHRTSGTSQEARQLTLDYARCIMCGLCVTHCPADALRMTEDYELAVSDREALRFITVFASSIDEDDANGKEKDNARPA
jgi:hydrogenase-4 component H